MPHLSPMLWLTMPLIMSTIMYSQMIMLFYQAPTFFGPIRIKTPQISPWSWHDTTDYMDDHMLPDYIILHGPPLIWPYPF